MNRIISLSFSLLMTAGIFLSAYAHAANNAVAGGPAQLVGTWRLELVDNILPDGRRVQLYGPDPVGLLMFDAAGHYAVQILRASRPRFAGNDKNNGTPEENRAAVQGSNSHFGRYTIKAGEGVLIFEIEHASFPNWEGTIQERIFTVRGDELRYTVPRPTTGAGATSEVVWRRVQ